MTGPRLLILLVLALAPVLTASPAPADTPDWRWPGRPTEAQEPCLARPPTALLEAFADGHEGSAGTHVYWDCRDLATRERPLAAIVLSRLRFEKDLGFPLPTVDIEIDHLRRDFTLADGRIRVEAFSMGNAACRSLIDGECRLGFAPTGSGWRLSRFEGAGPSVSEAPAGTLPDDFWDPAVVSAKHVVNFYTGLIWDVTPDPEGTPDTVQGRAATRHRLVSEEKGFPLFTSRFEHILWFDSDGELLRVCDYEQDLGFSHFGEMVRRDMGIEPQGDCAAWFE